MNSVNLTHIMQTIERVAPLSLQEKWDNSGLQVGNRQADIRAVLTTVDVTPEVVLEAIEKGANLVVSHHPLIFRPVKSLTGETRTQKAIELAVKNDIAVYSAHTNLDNAENGVSRLVAELPGVPVRSVRGPLVPVAAGSTTGTGVICEVGEETSVKKFVESLRKVFPAMRHSDLDLCPQKTDLAAICGGSGAPFIEDAIRANCGIYITGDLKHHDFVDYADRIALVDCGHYETEKAAKTYLYNIVRENFPELPVYIAQKDKNPIE